MGDLASATFETFYRDEYPSVLGMAYGLTGRAGVAEDLAQEAFLRAYARWDEVARMASPQGWVRRVAVNLAMSRFRRLRSEAAALLRLGPAEAGWQPASQAEHEDFWDAVRRLPRRQAQAVALRYVADLPVAEVGEALGVAEGTAKALLHQARQRLERQLAAKERHGV